MKLGAKTVAIVMALAGLSGGCNSSFPDAVRNTEGEFLRVELLAEIANDPNITDDEKTQIFNDLGLTDPDIIEFLLNS